MLKKIVKYLFISFVICSLIIGLFITSVYFGALGTLYSVDDLKTFKNQTATLVLSEDDKLIGKFFAENRTNTTYDKIPKGRRKYHQSTIGQKYVRS